jgi:hypothetical protein
MIVEVDNPSIGPFKQLGTPYKMSESPGSAMSYAVETGASNYEVFSGILKMTDEEIQALHERQKKKKARRARTSKKHNRRPQTMSENKMLERAKNKKLSLGLFVNVADPKWSKWRPTVALISSAWISSIT